MTTADERVITKEERLKAHEDWLALVSDFVRAEDEAQWKAVGERWRKNTLISGMTAWLMPILTWLNAMQAKNMARNARLDAMEKRCAALEKSLDAREWKGVWSDTAKYEKHNTVTWDGSSWYAVRDSLGRRPGQSDDWRLIVQRGKQGKQGERGESV